MIRKVSIVLSLILLFQFLPTNLFPIVPTANASGIDENTVLILHNDGDKSNSEHSLTVNGTPQITNTAKFGQALSLDGDGDYLRIADSDDWNFGTGNFTIDFWSKM